MSDTCKQCGDKLPEQYPVFMQRICPTCWIKNDVAKKLAFTLDRINLTLRAAPLFWEASLYEARQALEEAHDKAYTPEEVINSLNEAWRIYLERVGDEQAVRMICHIEDIFQL